MLCMVCGKTMSVVTTYRLWLRELVRSDECADCYAYMNTQLTCCGDSYASSYHASIIDIATRKKLA